MLTAREVAGVAAACDQARAPALFTLTVAGRVELDPPDARDGDVAAAFDAHQRRAVGGRRLLGPDAVGVATGAFAARGAAVDVRPSPWRLGPDDGELLAAWLRGWVAAASQTAPDLDAAGYLERRLVAAASGDLRVVVHHADLLVRWPEPVPQEHHVVDRARLDQRRAPVTGREAPGPGEPRRAGVPEEERRDDQVELVDETGGEERGVDGGAALDEQPAHTPMPQVGEHGDQVGRVAGVDDLREPGETPPQRGQRPAAGVDEAFGVAGGEEGGGGVEVAAGRQGDLRRVRGSPRAVRAACRAADRTSSRGSSARIVPAPTRIASLPARTSSTRSRSAAVERIRRRGDVSSR